MFTTIIFDLNRTLVTWENPIEGFDADEQYRKLTGLSEKDFWESAKTEYRKYCLGECSEEDFFKAMLKSHDLDIALAPKVTQLHDRLQSPVKGMPQLLDELRLKGYNLFLLAGDGVSLTKKKLKVLGKEHLFSKVYITADLKMSKQDPRIYTRIIRENGLRPDECLFVDDIRNHCQAADTAGLFPIVFTDVVSLRQQLERLRVL